MGIKILWVDDIRVPPSNIQCDIATSFDEAITFLSINLYDIIYLDHDLADFKDGKERTGYDITKWLVERKQNGLFIPLNYRFLTSNPVGRRNMQAVIDHSLIGE